MNLLFHSFGSVENTTSFVFVTTVSFGGWVTWPLKIRSQLCGGHSLLELLDHRHAQ